MAKETQPSPKGPYKLVTCNQNPERAKLIVGRLLEEVKNTYTIIHVANSPNIDGVKALVEQHRPDLLFTASMWTPEEAKQIISIAKEVVPDVKTMSMPKGLQAEKGTDAVIEYAINYLPTILE